MNIQRALIIILGLIGFGAYATRRRWLARWLGLPAPKYVVAVESAVSIPMTDGIRLKADHYFPRSRGTFPTVLIRTPYGRDLQGGLLGLLHVFAAHRFAERGYHVIVQDTRGRFDSEGEFEPFVDEKRDGLDTLHWISRQPWFDGNLGTWGPSYEGYVQWAIAADAPDYLKAMVPSITGSQIQPYSGKAFGLAGMLRWLMNLTRTGNAVTRLGTEILGLIDPRSQDRLVHLASRRLPISEADTIAVNQPVFYFSKWLSPENESADATFWKSIYHAPNAGRIHAAMHLMGGWYDVFILQMTEDYAALKAAGHSPHLTLGPWRHFDVACTFESLRAGLDWFEIHLKGNERLLRAKSVRLFLMGADEWREYDEFPPPSTVSQFYLRAQQQLSIDGADSLSEPDHYRYDPANPTPSLGGSIYDPRAGSVDNRTLEARTDVLSFTTPSLQNDVDIIGVAQLELYTQSSIPHVDLFVRLCDVYPDGRSMNICDGFVRLDSGDGAWQPDAVRRISLRFSPTAQRFSRGHRIRLLVASGAHPRWARNLGTGEPAATATRMQSAEIMIYHDMAHPSVLALPIIDHLS